MTASPAAPAPRPRRALLLGAAAIGFALALTLQALAIEGQSLTGDEAYHLLAGHQALRYGANLVNWEHPPLAKLVGALPTLAGDPIAPPLRVERALGSIATLHRDERLLGLTNAARWWMAAVFGVPLLLACDRLGRRFGGAWAGLLLALMVGLAFPFVPFLSMVLTDAPLALATVATVLACLRYVDRPGTGRAAALGLAFGLALATKFSAVLLLPTLLAALAMAATAARPRRALRLAGEAAAALALAVLAVWAVYAIANRRAPEEALRRTAIAYVEGRGTLQVGDRLLAHREPLARLATSVPAAGQWLTGALGVAAQNEIGVYQCYLFGRVDARGFRWYFPAVALLKTPLAILLAAAACAALSIRRARETGPARSTWTALRRADGALVAITVVVYLVAAVASTYDIGGVRHLLPVVPLLLLPLAVCLSHRPLAGLAVVAVLAIESLALAPLWLAATNTWWLGDRNPTRLALSHGDLEYRQSFRALAEVAEARGLGALRVMYPGIQPEILRPYLPQAELVGPGSEVTPGWYAVSALVEQFVPAILSAEPGALRHEGLRRLAMGYRPVWRRVREGEDHGWVAGTFHLYRVPSTPDEPAARQR